jgi:hypothetical protein
VEGAERIPQDGPAPSRSSSGAAGNASLAAAAFAADRRFFAVVLWLCAGAAAYLLFGAAAFNLRAMSAQVEESEAAARREWIRNAGLERWRDGLAGDASVIEREARKLGYGRAGERVYPISEAEWKAARARWAADADRAAPSGASALGQAFLPAVTLLILGAIAVLFFSDLRVDDPNRP